MKTIALALLLSSTLITTAQAETTAPKPTVRVESVKSGAEVAAELAKQEKAAPEPKEAAKPAPQAKVKPGSKPKGRAPEASKGKTKADTKPAAKGTQTSKVKTKSR